jgi:glycerophosphoryl diester phosphodiesterase
MMNRVEGKMLVIRSSGWLCLVLTALMVSAAFSAQAGEKIVIAHRAASGYLMEHNLPSVALAVGMGSDYIEQDLVMTKDDQVIVLHDPTLARVTNVAEVFPGRNRADGKFYALDFTLAEIKRLRLREPYSNIGNGQGRFPDTGQNLQLSIPTFKEELELIRGLEKTMRRDIGIYPEIKQPWLHRQEGKDISLAVLKILREYHYTTRVDKIFVQCFDPDELKRIHDELFPALGMDLKLTQLIDDNNGNETKTLEWGEWVNYNYDWILSKSGLRAASAYISGIGMDKSMLVDGAGNLLRPTLIDDAHQLGLVVHPYTFRREKESLPSYAPSFEALLEFFYFKVGVDGVFTDYCGDAVLFLESRPDAPAPRSAAGEILPSQPVVSPESPEPPRPPQTAPIRPASAPEPEPPAAPVAPAVIKPLPTNVPAAPSGAVVPDTRLPIVITGPESDSQTAPAPPPTDRKSR